ncbi:MAG: hypothetical protein D6715_07900 [Calditrichaeota bacterium]|nr:MAG: hypothetical protein D6715_07900 [Calditrichota bacterium]
MKRSILAVLGVVVLAVGILAVTSGRFCGTQGSATAGVTKAAYHSDCAAKGTQASSDHCAYHKAAVKQTSLEGKTDCDPSQCDETARAAHPECRYGKTASAKGAHPGCEVSKKNSLTSNTDQTSAASLVKVD